MDPACIGKNPVHKKDLRSTRKSINHLQIARNPFLSDMTIHLLIRHRRRRHGRLFSIGNDEVPPWSRCIDKVKRHCSPNSEDYHLESYHYYSLKRKPIKFYIED